MKIAWVFLFLLFLQPVLGSSKINVRLKDFPENSVDSKAIFSGSEAEIEIVELILEKAGFSPNYIVTPWNRALKEIENGKIDLMFSIGKRKSREKFIYFIGPSRYEQMVLVVHKDSNIKVENVSDLFNLKQKVGILDGVFYPLLTPLLKTDSELKNKIKILHQPYQGAKMTTINRLSGFFEGRNWIGNAIKSKELFKRLKIHGFSLGKPKALYLGASMKLPSDIRKRLKKTYLKSEESGEIERIWYKWWGVN